MTLQEPLVTFYASVPFTPKCEVCGRPFRRPKCRMWELTQRDHHQPHHVIFFHDACIPEWLKPFALCRDVDATPLPRDGRAQEE